eukprot:3470326-Amphidinium_carterae.1
MLPHSVQGAHQQAYESLLVSKLKNNEFEEVGSLTTKDEPEQAAASFAIEPEREQAAASFAVEPERESEVVVWKWQNLSKKLKDKWQASGQGKP